MRFSILRRMIVFMTIVAMLASFAACGGKGNNEPAASTVAAESSAPASTVPEEVVDPLGKYDPAIEISSCIAIGPDCIFAEGEDINNNTWTRNYEADLGIKLKYDWTADGSQFGQKLNMVIASNDMPDFFVAGPEQIKMLTDSEQIWDLTSIYEKWASEDTKGYLTQDPIGFKSAHVDGKMMGLPLVDSSAASASLLWIRNDWLKNLNLQVPTNMQEVLAVAKAFATQDPDKNGKNDTFGLGANKDLWTAFSSLSGFFNSYHAYVGNSSFWLKDAGGQIVSGNNLPETRIALLALQGMFKDGLIDKEFGVKDNVKVAEDTASGKIGMQFGAWWNPDWPLNANKQKDPKADWLAYPIVSSDDKPALHGYGNYVSSYIVVNKDYEHPEAVVKMMNYWWNVIKNMSMENAQKYIFNVADPASNQVYYKYINIIGWEPNGKANSYMKVQDALKTGDTSKLGLEELEVIKYLDMYNKGDNAGWTAYTEMGPQGSYAAIIKVIEGAGLCSVFYGASTPVMAEKMPALTKMQNEVFTNIILGEPIENFDKFVTDWKKLGGDEITKEVNDWYAKNY